LGCGDKINILFSSINILFLIQNSLNKNKIVNKMSENKFPSHLPHIHIYLTDYERKQLENERLDTVWKNICCQLFINNPEGLEKRPDKHSLSTPEWIKAREVFFENAYPNNWHEQNIEEIYKCDNCMKYKRGTELGKK
jgi:hypothetical protein